MASTWGLSWASSWGGSWGALADVPVVSTPVTGARKPSRKLRINHIFLRDDEPIKELPPPTKKRIKAVVKAILADAEGLLGTKPGPVEAERVLEQVRSAYQPQSDPAALSEALRVYLMHTVEVMRAKLELELEQDDEDLLHIL